MKQLLIYIVFLLVTLHLHAQVEVTIPDNGCAINTISTNPYNYQNSSDPSETYKWNWMTEDFTVYYTQDGQGTTGFPATLRSPFFELVTNSNTLHFVDQIEKDFLPENGWELMSRNFGSTAQGVKNPFFILYNRYTGTIRTFVNIRNTGNVSSNIATLTLRFADGEYRTALFNQLGELTNAENKFNSNARGIGSNKYVNSGVNDNYYWLWADFISLYDPCSCGLESDLQLEVSLLSESKVTMSINGTETTLLDNTTGNNTFEENTIFKAIKQYADFGNSLVSDVQGLFGSANAAFDKGTELQNDANEFVLNNGPLFGHQSAASIAREVGHLLFEVPRVNSWLKFSSTLITVVKKTTENINNLNASEKLDKLSNVTLTTKKTNLKVTGDIAQTSVFSDPIFALPGSNQTNVANFRKAVYNNVLGVFNLLEQPKVKITKYNAPSSLYYQVGSFPNAYLEDNAIYDVFTPIYRVEVLNELTPMVNPASGLKIKSLESRLEFINREAPQNKLKGPMIPGPLATFTDFGFQATSASDREVYYSDNGYSLMMYAPNAPQNNPWDKALMATPYLPQGCFQSTSLYTFSTMENVVIKVKVILEPLVNNPNSDVEDVIIVFTYPADITNVTSPSPYIIDGAIVSGSSTLVYNESYSTFPLGITIPGVTYSPIMGMGSDAYFTNKIIDHDYMILGDLTIGPNVKVNPGVHTIKATGNIFFDNSLILNNVSIPVDYSNYNNTFIAGEEIVVSPQTIVSPETVLMIDESLGLPCELDVPQLVNPTAIKTYCESNDYETRIAARNGIAPNEEPDVAQALGVISDEFVLFPNPAKSSVNVHLGREALNCEIQLFDIAGKQVDVKISVLNNADYQLDLSNCQQGVYLITVMVDGNTKTKQLIVQ